MVLQVAFKKFKKEIEAGQTIIRANVAARGSLRSELEAGAGWTKSAHIIVVQEHKLSQDEIGSTRHSLPSQGWSS